MKQLNTTNCGILGPFDSVLTLSDRYLADDSEYSFLVLGDSTIEEYSGPITHVPKEITMRQARLALLMQGKLNLVQQAIDQMPEPIKSAANIEWEYSNTVMRHNGFVSQLGPLIGLTEQQIDDLFITASNL